MGVQAIKVEVGADDKSWRRMQKTKTVKVWCYGSELKNEKDCQC
jgi:hypothetical protein